MTIESKSALIKEFHKLSHAFQLTSAIDTIKAVRHFMASHLRSIVDSDWSKYVFTFGDGKGFNLEEALQHFNGNVGFHRDLINRNIRLFEKTYELVNKV